MTFSHYDNFLDAAFKCRPALPQNLTCSDLERTSALGRGWLSEMYASAQWANGSTLNYHYIVPKFEKDTKQNWQVKILMSSKKPKNLDWTLSCPCRSIYSSIVWGLWRRRERRLCDNLVATRVFTTKNLVRLVSNWWSCSVKDLTAEESLSEPLQQTLADKGPVSWLKSQWVTFRRLRWLNLPVDAIGLDFVEGKKNSRTPAKGGLPQLIRLSCRYVISVLLVTTTKSLRSE